MFVVKYQNLMISQVPKMKNITAHNWLEQVTKSADKERYEGCWSPHTVGEHLKLYSENHFRKQNVNLLYIKTIQGHSGARMQPHFFSRQILELGRAEELHHSGYAKFENNIEERGLVPGGFDQNEGPQAVHFTLVSPLDKKRTNSTGITNTYVSPRHDLRCGHGRRAEKQ